MYQVHICTRPSAPVHRLYRTKTDPYLVNKEHQHYPPILLSSYPILSYPILGIYPLIYLTPNTTLSLVDPSKYWYRYLVLRVRTSLPNYSLHHTSSQPHHHTTYHIQTLICRPRRNGSFPGWIHRLVLSSPSDQHNTTQHNKGSVGVTTTILHILPSLSTRCTLYTEVCISCRKTGGGERVKSKKVKRGTKKVNSVQPTYLPRYLTT